jgi:hypothetical protein
MDGAESVQAIERTQALVIFASVLLFFGCRAGAQGALFSKATSSEVVLIKRAAGKYFAAVTWRADSVVSGDFTCSVKKDWAILGTNTSELLIAMFISGPGGKPEVLRHSGSAPNPSTVALSIEDLNYDPQKETGYALPGFQRSKTCKGLDLSDGEIDSAHIYYWNHKGETVR